VQRLQALAARVSRTFPARVILKFIADDGPNYAVLIAWNGLFSLFPIILALVALAGYVLAFIGLSADSLTQLVVTFIPDSAAQQQAIDSLNALAQRRGPLALLALASFIWAASFLFGAMEAAFARIFDCQPRDFVRQKVMSLAMMGIFSLLAIVAIGTAALRALLDSLPRVHAVLSSEPSTSLLQAVIGTVAGVLMFLVIYLVVPNREIRIRHAWPGALVAGVSFEVLTLVFPIYITLNKGINQYGQAFGLLFVLMFFFFVLGIITVIGAEINAVLFGGRMTDEAEAGRRPEPRSAAGERKDQVGPEPS
jgi:membrane protein